MPSGPAVFAWIWLNREHESFMNCASVQIGPTSGNSTVCIHSSSTADSTTCHTALPAPTDGIPREGEPQRLASDACDWKSAPRMETSYYSTDADCEPNAKLNKLSVTVWALGYMIQVPSVSPGHFTSHVVYPLTNQSTTPCIYPSSGTHR
jgi:hypothetical protein